MERLAAVDQGTRNLEGGGEGVSLEGGGEAGPHGGDCDAMVWRQAEGGRGHRGEQRPQQGGGSSTPSVPDDGHLLRLRDLCKQRHSERDGVTHDALHHRCEGGGGGGAGKPGAAQQLGPQDGRLQPLQEGVGAPYEE